MAVRAEDREVKGFVELSCAARAVVKGVGE
jgi:hypothetical protein